MHHLIDTLSYFRTGRKSGAEEVAPELIQNAKLKGIL